MDISYFVTKTKILREFIREAGTRLNELSENSRLTTRQNSDEEEDASQRHTKIIKIGEADSGVVESMSSQENTTSIEFVSPYTSLPVSETPS